MAEYLLTNNLNEFGEAAKKELAHELLQRILLEILGEVMMGFLKEKEIKLIWRDNSLYLHIQNQNKLLKELFGILNKAIDKFIEENNE